MADGHESREVGEAEAGESREADSRTSGVYRRALDPPPVRPLRAAVLLPSGRALPPISDRVEVVRSSSEDVNVRFVHTGIDSHQFDAILRSAARRPAWQPEGMGTVPPLIVFGPHSPEHARLGIRARARSHHHDSDDDLAYVFDHAVALAEGHAQIDPLSQLRWSRGTLGAWVGRSLAPARLAEDACALVGLALHNMPRDRMASLLGITRKRLNIRISKKVLEPTGKPDLERLLGVLSPAFSAGAAGAAEGGQRVPLPIPPPILDPHRTPPSGWMP